MLQQILDYINAQLFPRFTEIILTPLTQKELLWLVIPLLFILIFVQLYFGRNKTEQLGWNTAFGNAISLFWITVLLVRFTFGEPEIYNLPLGVILSGRYLQELILILILAVWTIFLAFFDYFHILSKKLAFLISSSVTINVTAYIFLVIILGDIPIDLTTLYASLFLIISIALFFDLFRAIIKPSESAKETLERRKLKEAAKREYKRRKRKQKIEEIEKKIKELLPNKR